MHAKLLSKPRTIVQRQSIPIQVYKFRNKLQASALDALSQKQIKNYVPFGTQGMLVKNVTNHNALHFELLNTMHQIGCCLARSL